VLGELRPGGGQNPIARILGGVFAGANGGVTDGDHRTRTMDSNECFNQLYMGKTGKQLDC
jgi:hypothetical protein